MYKIAICDDDDDYRQYIKGILLSSGFEDEIIFYEFCSGEDLLTDLKGDNYYDILILDMQLEGMNGNETAKQFRLKSSDTILIFCSGKCQPSVKSFEVLPYRYLLKQYTDKKMVQEFKSVVELMKGKKEEPYIIGNYHYNVIKLKPNEILYIAIAKRGSRIFLCPNIAKYEFENHITSKHKVESLYEGLKDYGFVYAHNSYIVNLRYVKRKTMTELELIDGTILSISRSKEKELRQALAEYLAKKY